MDAMIRQIVNRCHVSESNRKVIRYVISRLKNGYKTWQAASKVDRRYVMETAIKIHKENRDLYYDVMSGNL